MLNCRIKSEVAIMNSPRRRTHPRAYLKAIVSFQCLAALILALSGCTTFAIVDPPPPPPSPEDITDSWILVGAHRAYHLNLLPDGTARLVAVYFSEEPWEYIADHWDLTGHNLSIDFEPVERAREPVYLRARATQHYLDVGISLSPTMPLRQGLFSREADFDQRLRILREAQLPHTEPEQ